MMITKIYKFFQRFWQILYLPVILLCDVVNYIIKDFEHEVERFSNLIKDTPTNWEEID